MKFQNIYLVVPLALLLISCGKSSTSDFSASASSGSVPGSNNNSSAVPGNGTGAGGTTTNICTNVALRPIYNDTVTGTGTGSATTDFRRLDSNNYLTADTRLRLVIKPVANSTSFKYNKAGATVSLIHNTKGVLKSIVVPGTTESYTPTTGYTFSFAKGIETGTSSDIIDFSSALVKLKTGEYYSIRFSAVQNDYRCTNYCTVSNYAYSAATGNGCWSATNGMCPTTDSWNFDYNTKSFSACCVKAAYNAWGSPYQVGDNILQVCQQKKCGVSPLLAIDDTNGVQWQFEVTVETDSTPCLQ